MIAQMRHKQINVVRSFPLIAPSTPRVHGPIDGGIDHLVGINQHLPPSLQNYLPLSAIDYAPTTGIKGRSEDRKTAIPGAAGEQPNRGGRAQADRKDYGQGPGRQARDKSRAIYPEKRPGEGLHRCRERSNAEPVHHGADLSGVPRSWTVGKVCPPLGDEPIQPGMQQASKPRKLTLWKLYNDLSPLKDP